MKVYLLNFYNRTLTKESLDKLSLRAKNKMEKLSNANPLKANQVAHCDLLLNYIFKQNGIENYEILQTEQGKPYLKDENLQFSVSHCDSIVAVCVNDSNCGVDVEKLKTVDEKVVNSCLNEYEKQRYQMLEDGEDKQKFFFKTFTTKESFIKFKGENSYGFFKNIKDYSGAKFVTKVIFLDDKIYCITVCSDKIDRLEFCVVGREQII